MLTAWRRGSLDPARHRSTFVLSQSRHWARPMQGAGAFWRGVPDGDESGVPSLVANALIDVNWTWSRSSGPVGETSRCRVSKSDYGARAADLAASGLSSTQNPTRFFVFLFIAWPGNYPKSNSFCRWTINLNARSGAMRGPDIVKTAIQLG
jgi:hypothetical protein